MTYRSLLVPLDNDPQCGARCAAAMQLARHLDAHLVGVAATGLVEFPSVTEDAAALIEFVSLTWDRLRDRAEQLTEGFRDACRKAGLRSFEAVIDEADKAESLVRHAHCADLAVLSRADPSAAGHRVAQELGEQIVLHSARPTLVLPCAGAPATFGTDIMVAWDDSREAARALSDALPLLRLARRVRVVTWVEGGDNPEALRQHLKAVQSWLMRHGVTAEVRVETAGAAVADALLAHAADLGADLIVMGAYGYARWAEYVLGGATRSVLASATVPVLMSH
jgi:nucleotide-binding universal stress UspA family protein